MIQWARKTERIYYHLDYSQTFKWISTHFYYFLEKRETRSLLALSVSRRLRFWELLGSIFDDLGGFLAVRLNIKKPWKTICFWRFFEGLGSRMEAKSKKIWPGWPCWVQVGLSWAILAASWAVLEDVGSKMERNGAIRSAKRSHQRLPDGKGAHPPVVFDTGLGSLVPTIHRLQLLRS